MPTQPLHGGILGTGVARAVEEWDQMGYPPCRVYIGLNISIRKKMRFSNKKNDKGLSVPQYNIIFVLQLSNLTKLIPLQIRHLCNSNILPIHPCQSLTFLQLLIK